MDKEIMEADDVELRITGMKAQFQASYDVFIKAHEDLSKISFDPSAFADTGLNSPALAQLETKEIDEILDAGTIDDCIRTLRSKINTENEAHQNCFPKTKANVTKLLKIMNGLQTDIESLTDKQKQIVKLTTDISEEMSMFEKRMEDSMSQLDDLVLESMYESDSIQDDGCFDEDEKTFGSELLSD
jgi:hypothetical protein